MKLARWSAIVGLAVAAIAPFGQVTEAASPERVTATSSRTGITYTATWSCAGGQVRIAGVHNGGTAVTMRFQVLPSSGSVLSRQIPANSGSFSFETGAVARNDNDRSQVVVEDGFQGSNSYVPVLTLDVPDCPDYNAGTRNVFQGVTPERVLDTRAESLVNYSGPKPGPGAIVKIPASAFPGLPANATAVSLTLTGTQASGPGFLQAFPTEAATPGSSSNVNLTFSGATVANLAVVPLGTDRSISILTSGGAHLLADVNGYFVPTNSAVRAGRFEALTTQKRMLDTRPATQVHYNGGAKPNGFTIPTFDLKAGSSGLPAGSAAAVVNITATESDGPGFVQVAAGGTLVPGKSSVLNLTGANQTVAGLSIVPLDAQGRIDIYSSGSTHLIVDLIGWFTGPAAANSTAGLFVPLAPERVYDSRLDSMVNVDTFWDAAGVTGQVVYLPALEQRVGAIFVNGTGTGNVSPGFVTLGTYDKAQPTSTLNLPVPNATVANAAIVRGTLGFPVYASSRSHVIVDLAGYFTLATA